MVSDETRGEVDTRLFNWLAYLGVVPFVIGIVMAAFQYSVLGVDGRLWFTAYSAVILSFLCGVWWGGALNRLDHVHRLPLMLLSNIIALVGWVALLFYQAPLALPVLMVAFLFVERAEARLKPNLSFFSGYFKTRTRVSYLVVACHLAMIAILWR
ncbi:DUF3429 domain-containing protein [Microbulbifer mangrovi]|uniref:DUF3429 domain-containing protein n=1 Tax=Microbulbifer mangrovi TaxID=927787 RepID=UPI0009908B5F|nr:DUF3429 domain-containing protein [Microbulbifer mangrovi]